MSVYSTEILTMKYYISLHKSSTVSSLYSTTPVARLQRGNHAHSCWTNFVDWAVSLPDFTYSWATSPILHPSSRPFVVDTWHSKLKETPASDPVFTIPSSFSHKILHRASSMLSVMATTQEASTSSILPLDSLRLGRTSRRGVPERLELDAEGGTGTGRDQFWLVQQSLLPKGVAGAG